jgi:UDP-2,4-diacetamido-2,4,6-trideoxy-beta-L-altropyranose hydrolase
MPVFRREGIRVHIIDAEPGSKRDGGLTCGLAKKQGASWIVIDGYLFTGRYQKQIKKAGFSLFCIDDTGQAGPYHADVILNQNLYAEAGMYADIQPGTQLLMGSRYALLRDEFRTARDRRRVIPEKAWHILISLGGSDPDNRTKDIVNAVALLPSGSCDVRVIAGGCNPHYDDLVAFVKKNRPGITLLHNVDDMADNFIWADLAICGGGSTTLELACLGVPMVALELADNQIRVCEALEKAGAAVRIASADDQSPETVSRIISQVIGSKHDRLKLSRNSRRLVDGRGPFRVAPYLCGEMITHRIATPEDSRMVFDWINDPYVREQSFNTSPITPEEHAAWFSARMKDPDSLYFIIGDKNGSPLGQVRYDTTGTEATISILIDRRYRGQNIGTRAMQITSQKLFEKTAVTIIHAYIKTTNQISCRAFARAGFVADGMTKKGDADAYHLDLRKT